jgi:hypothetical protein
MVVAAPFCNMVNKEGAGGYDAPHITICRIIPRHE